MEVRVVGVTKKGFGGVGKIAGGLGFKVGLTGFGCRFRFAGFWRAEFFETMFQVG